MGDIQATRRCFRCLTKRLPDDLVDREHQPAVPAGKSCRRARQEIHNRVNEISFNSSLLRELRAISFVKRLIAEGQMSSDQMRDVLVHMIADDALMRDLSIATKLIPTAVMLSRLKEAGRQAAKAFLAAHRSDLNTRSTVDMEEMFG